MKKEKETADNLTKGIELLNVIFRNKLDALKDKYGSEYPKKKDYRGWQEYGEIRGISHSLNTLEFLNKKIKEGEDEE